MDNTQTVDSFNCKLTGNTIAIPNAIAFGTSLVEKFEREKKLEKLLAEPILTQPDFTPLRSTLILTKWEIQEIVKRLKEFTQ